MNKQLNSNQGKALEHLSNRPSSGYGHMATFKALVTRGYAKKTGWRGGFEITPAGCAYLGVDPKLVAVAYAFFNLNNGRQIRHNVLMVVEPFFRHEDYELRHEWYQRTMEEEISSIHDYQMRAIELARAEIRAGIAGN